MKKLAALFSVIAFFLTGCALGLPDYKDMKSDKRYYGKLAGERPLLVLSDVFWEKNARNIYSFIGPPTCCWGGKYYSDGRYLMISSMGEGEQAYAGAEVWVSMRHPDKSRGQSVPDRHAMNRSRLAKNSIESQSLLSYLQYQCGEQQRASKKDRQYRLYPKKVYYRSRSFDGVACFQEYKLLPPDHIEEDGGFVGFASWLGDATSNIYCPIRVDGDDIIFQIRTFSRHYKDAGTDDIWLLPRYHQQGMLAWIDERVIDPMEESFRFEVDLDAYVEPNNEADNFECGLDEEIDGRS